MQLHPITATLPIDEHQYIFSHFRDEYLKQPYSNMHIFGYMDVDYGRYFQSSKPVLDIYLDFFMKVIETHLNEGGFTPEDGAFNKELAAIAAIEDLPPEQIRKLENILVFSAAQSSRFMYEVDMCGPVHVNALAALLTNKSTSDADANRLLSTLLTAGMNDTLVTPDATINVNGVYMSDFVLMAFREIAKMDSVSANRVSMLVDCVTGVLDQLASGSAEKDEVKFKLYIERISSTLRGIVFNAQINEVINDGDLSIRELRDIEQKLIYVASNSVILQKDPDMSIHLQVKALSTFLMDERASKDDVLRVLSTLIRAGANDTLDIPDASINTSNFFMSEFISLVFTEIEQTNGADTNRVSMLLDCANSVLNEMKGGENGREYHNYINRLLSDINSIDLLDDAESCSATQLSNIEKVLVGCLRDIMDATDAANLASPAINIFDALNSSDCNKEQVIAYELVRVMFWLGPEGSLSKSELKNKKYDLAFDGGVKTLGVSGVLSEAVEFFYKKHDGTIQDKISVVDDFWRCRGSFSYSEEYREFSDALLRGANLSKDFFIETLNAKVFSVHLNEAIDAKCHLSPLNKDELAELLDRASSMYATLSGGGRSQEVEARELKLFVRAIVSRFYNQCYLAPLLFGQPVDHAEFAPLFVDGVRNDVFSPLDVTVISRIGMTKLYEAAGEALRDVLQSNQPIHDIVVSAILQEKVDAAMMMDRSTLSNRSKRQL